MSLCVIVANRMPCFVATAHNMCHYELLMWIRPCSLAAMTTHFKWNRAKSMLEAEDRARQLCLKLHVLELEKFTNTKCH